MSSPAGPTVSTPVLAAWQAALAAEHAAVYGYGTVGPKLGRADQNLARAFETEHRSLRDHTESTIVALGALPVGARADYPPSAPITSAAVADVAALQLENDCAAAWRYLLAAAAAAGPSTSATQGARSAGQANLTASAIRAMRWRLRTDPAHPTEAFPGI